MIGTRPGLGTGLFVIAMLVAVAPSAYAETVSVSIDGTSHDIEYVGANVSINSADIDADFVSIIFGVDAAAGGTLEITFPRDVFDSEFDGADDPFIVIADGAESDFSEIGTTPTSRTLSISVEAGTQEVEIVGTIFGKGLPAEDDPATCPADYAPVCGVDGTTYSNMCSLDTAGVALDNTGECQVQPDPVPACGEGTVLRDGTCVPACGPGLVLEDGACVLEQTDTACGPGLVLEDGVCVLEQTDTAPAEDPAPIAGVAEPEVQTQSSGSGMDFAYGTVAAFVIAFIVVILLGLVAWASRSRG